MSKMNDTNQSSGTAVLEALRNAAARRFNAQGEAEYYNLALTCEEAMRSLAAPTPPEATQERAIAALQNAVGEMQLKDAVYGPGPSNYGRNPTKPAAAEAEAGGLPPFPDRPMPQIVRGGKDPVPYVRQPAAAEAEAGGGYSTVAQPPEDLPLISDPDSREMLETIDLLNAHPAAAAGEGRTQGEVVAEAIEFRDLDWSRWTFTKCADLNGFQVPICGIQNVGAFRKSLARLIDRELAAATAAAEARAGEIVRAAKVCAEHGHSYDCEVALTGGGTCGCGHDDLVDAVEAAAVAAGQGERSGNKP
jgi:hypothetical protein